MKVDRQQDEKILDEKVSEFSREQKYGKEKIIHYLFFLNQTHICACPLFGKVNKKKSESEGRSQ